MRELPYKLFLVTWFALGGIAGYYALGWPGAPLGVLLAFLSGGLIVKHLER